MKTALIWIMILFVLLVRPHYSFAYSYLETSNPYDGEVITEQLTDIEPLFDRGIEDVSTVQIINENGNEMKLSDRTVTSMKLHPTVEESQLGSEDEEREKWFMIPIAIIGLIVIFVIVCRNEKK